MGKYMRLNIAYQNDKTEIYAKSKMECKIFRNKKLVLVN